MSYSRLRSGAALTLLAVASCAWGQAYKIEEIDLVQPWPAVPSLQQYFPDGDFEGLGTRSVATAINDAGQVVGTSLTKRPGGYNIPGPWYQDELAFVWSNGVLTELPALSRQLTSVGGNYTVYTSFAAATGINESGVVCGQSHTSYGLGNSGTWQAVVWQGGLISSVGDHLATAINDAGDVAIQMDTGFVLRAGILTPLGLLSGSSSGVPRSLSYDGTVVGSSWFDDLYSNRATVWNDSVPTLLALPVSEYEDSWASAINDNGQIVGTIFVGDVNTGNYRAAVWQGGTVQDLGTLVAAGGSPPDGNSESEAFQNNDQGDIVGTAYHAIPGVGGVRYAVLWRNGSIVNLNDEIPAAEGWTLVDANDINNLGQIVGWGHHNGFQRGFVLTPHVMARNEQLTTDEDTPVTADLTANDEDIAAHPLSIVIVTPPQNGSVVTSVGSATYTPAANFNGTDSFTYRATDGTYQSTVATVTLIVNPINDAPDAVDDSAAVELGSQFQIDALYNDADVDGNPLTISGVTQGSRGIVTNQGSHLMYTANQGGGPGTDTFTYTISDGQGSFDTATVTINLTTANVPPRAINDHATTDLETPVEIDLLANDFDPNGDPLSLSSFSQPASGSLLLLPNGTLQYVPDVGHRGNDTFTYTISDGRGGSSTGRVRIRIR